MKKFRYKLTDENLKTCGGCDWRRKDWKKTDGIGELCTSGWLHCYSHPLIAVLLNPIHANFKNARLLKVEVNGQQKDDNGIKEGWTEMRKVAEIKLPEITLNQRIGFAVYCALKNYREAFFLRWAKNWISGKDRTIQSAEAVEHSVEEIDYSAEAVRHSASAARHSASAAAHSAEAVRHSASAARHSASAAEHSTEAVRQSTEAAAHSTEAAEHSAEAVRQSTEAAEKKERKINFIQLAKKAMEIK